MTFCFKKILSFLIFNNIPFYVKPIYDHSYLSYEICSIDYDIDKSIGWILYDNDFYDETGFLLITYNIQYKAYRLYNSNNPYKIITEILSKVAI